MACKTVKIFQPDGSIQEYIFRKRGISEPTKSEILEHQKILFFYQIFVIKQTSVRLLQPSDICLQIIHEHHSHQDPHNEYPIR